MINEKYWKKTKQNEAKILLVVSLTFSNVKAEIPYDGFHVKIQAEMERQFWGGKGGIRRRKIVTGMEQLVASWPLRLPLQM